MADQNGTVSAYDLFHPFGIINAIRNGGVRNGSWTRAAGDRNFYIWVEGGNDHGAGPSAPPAPGYGLDGYPIAGTPQAAIPGTTMVSSSSPGSYFAPAGGSLGPGTVPAAVGGGQPGYYPPPGYSPYYQPPQQDGPGFLGQFLGGLLSGIGGGGQQQGYPPPGYPPYYSPAYPPGYPQPQQWGPQFYPPQY